MSHDCGRVTIIMGPSACEPPQRAREIDRLPSCPSDACLWYSVPSPPYASPLTRSTSAAAQLLCVVGWFHQARYCSALRPPVKLPNHSLSHMCHIDLKHAGVGVVMLAKLRAWGVTTEWGRSNSSQGLGARRGRFDRGPPTSTTAGMWGQFIRIAPWCTAACRRSSFSRLAAKRYFDTLGRANHRQLASCPAFSKLCWLA